MSGVQCMLCKHYRRGTTCAAFPDGIPEDVWSAYVRHDKPLPGQGNDIVFERRAPAEESSVEG